MTRRNLIWTNTFRFNPAGWRPGAATRCTLALALPVLGAALIGHPAWGVAMGIGAFNAGILSLNGVYRSRIRQMISVALVVSATALLAGLVSASPWLTVLLVTALSFGFTLFSERGPGPTSMGLQSTMVLIVISGLPASPAGAFGTAALVLAGALLQVLVLGLLWPVDPHQPERRVVAQVFQELARYVQAFPVALDHPFPDEVPFQTAQGALSDAAQYHWRNEHDRLVSAYSGAEGLRAALVGLGRADRLLREQGGAAAEDARLASRVLARLLRAIAQAVTRHRTPLVPEGALRAFTLATSRVTQQAAGPDADARAEFGALARLVAGLLHDLEAPGMPAFAPAQPPRPSPLPTLRDVIGRPEARLHALRYALAVGGATALYKFTGLGHGYWLPLTVGLVLRQDYFTTVTRGLARFGGTLIGVLAATLIGLLHPPAGVAGLLVLLGAWLAYALLPTGYSVFSAAVTVYVVFSLAAAGVSEEAAGVQRLMVTLAGGVLALLAFLAWPLWKVRRAQEVLRDAARAQVTYAECVLATLRGDPMGGDLEASRARSRAARVQAEGAVQAASVEPNWAAPESERLALGARLARLSGNAALLVSLQLEAKAEARPPDLVPRAEAALGVARALAGEAPHTPADATATA